MCRETLQKATYAELTNMLGQIADRKSKFEKEGNVEGIKGMKDLRIRVMEARRKKPS
jgi:hypothetical protein